MPEEPFSHRQPRSWQKITITIPAGHADIAANYLAVLSGGGVEFATGKNINSRPQTETISVYFNDDATLQDKKNKLENFLINLGGGPSDSPPVFQEENIREEDWGTSWKKHFKPRQITRRITVKPSWEKYSGNRKEIIVEIDPGMAFGTGLHASTSMCLEFIDECFVEKKVKTMLDVGTGTGILGITGALLGAEVVLGIDNDPDAVAAAQENIKKNKVANSMAAELTGLQDISGPFELITANITHDILLQLLPDLTALLAPGASLIMAGILRGSQAENIENSCRNLGLKTAGKRCSDEWAAFLFCR